jgi:Protein of unknown function (DUF4238)
MNSPNRHHYLPVFYLKKWVGKDGRLVRYHRPHHETVTSRLTPDYTGFEDGLYTLHGASADSRQMIETDFFSPLDNAAAPILELLIAQGPSALTNEQRSVWTRFVMSLQLRSPQSLVEIKAMIDRNVRTNLERLDGARYAATKREGDPDSVYEYALQRAPEQMTNFFKTCVPDLIDHEDLGQLIINMKWAVMDLSAAAHTLLTADRPVSTSHGLVNPACLLSVPLSPTHLFVAANGIARLVMFAAQKPGNTVRDTNCWIAKLAVQNVYGCTDEHLAFVETVLRRAADPCVPGVITRN